MRATTILVSLATLFLMQALLSAGEEPVPTLVEALEDPDRGVRFAAANGLGKLGPGGAAAVPALTRAVADPEWCVRLEAVWALGRVGEAAAPDLRQLLTHRTPVIRLVAARSLYEGAPGAAEEALLGLLEAKNRVIGLQAAGSLVHGDPENASAVVPLLTKAALGEAWDQHQQACVLLTKLGPKAVSAAEAIAKWKPGERQTWYLPQLDKVLLSMGEEAIPAIENALDHVDPNRQVALRDVIDRIRGTAPPPPKEAPAGPKPGPAAPPAEASVPVTLKVLVRGLTDDDPVTRETTVFALVRAGAAAVPYLIPRLIRVDHRAQALAARVLGEIGPAARMAVPALIARLSAGHVEMRIRSALALGRIGDPQTVHSLALRLNDSERDVRIAAAIALRGFHERGVAPLRRALADENWRVRRHALESLAAIGPAAAPAAVDICACLTDDWMMVGFAARKAVEGIGPAAAFPLAREVAKGHYGVLSHAERIFEVLGTNGRPAVPVLIALLSHEDVNLREVAARTLGTIGPNASAAVPRLIGALSDTRIGVRDRAALALGRIGREGVPDLLLAARHADARVRAGAVFALGWIAGKAAGFDQAPVEFRLPVAEPGPIEATGFAPTAKQRERARSLRGIRKPHVVIEKLADLTRPEQVDVLRAGLRSDNVEVAVPCAGSLVMDDLDGWESERAVELLLSDCASKDGPNCFGDIYEYLGSAELPAILHHYRRASTKAPTGPLHRLVRADLLPELYRLVRAKDPVITAYDGDVWMPAGLTDRFRVEEAASVLENGFPEVEGPGLPSPLVGLLQREDPFDHMVNGWLSDSTPGPRDSKLLVALAERFADRNLPCLVRALARLDDQESMLALRQIYLRRTSGDRAFVRAALVARGDREAMRAVWREKADETPPEPHFQEDGIGGPMFMDSLLDLAPGFAAALMREVMLDPARIWWADGLEADLEDRGSAGILWRDTTFLGFEAAAFGADVTGHRLAQIALSVPGCRTKRLAGKILNALAQGAMPPEWIDYYTENPSGWVDAASLLPFLEATWPDRLRDLLRDWSNGPDEAASNRALHFLLLMGDRENAARLIDYVSSDPEHDSQGLRIGLLSRSSCPEVLTYLWGVATDEARDEEIRRAALVEILECRGIPENVTWGLQWSFMDDVAESDALLLAAARAEDPVEGLLLAARKSERSEDGELAGGLGGLRDPRVRAYLWERLEARERLSCAKLLGQLVLCGDAVARRELWAGVRMGRYRWICYQNDNDALSLGYAPEALPYFHYESESNCCRGGHCDRLLGQLIGDTHILGFMSYGQDATPSRAGRWWMDLYGGHFTPNPFAWNEHEAWTLTPEK